MNLELILNRVFFFIYCHLFHCKRGFNVINRCQLCTGFCVDSLRLSTAIQKEICLTKEHFDPKIISTVISERFYINIHYNSVVSSAQDDIETENFGIVYYDAVCNPMLLYILCIEICARIFINLIRKNVLNILIESVSDRKDIKIYKKTFSRGFFHQTCCYA